MLDAIVSNKTFGNATFRQFVSRGFQDFRGSLFAAYSSEKSPPPRSPTFRSRMGVPLLTLGRHRRPIPMPKGTFSTKFPSGIGGRHGRFFSAMGHLFPQPERVHSACQRCVLTED